MKGTTILLLGAATLVAYASAHPHSNIPEGVSLPDAYNYKKSSSNSNSNSYSQSNQDEADVNGAYHGQSFSGTKTSGYSTSGGSRSQSSSFSTSSFNGNIPPGLFGASGLPGASQTPSSYIQPDLAYGNPGTAGLGLNDKASGFASGAFSSSYGSSNAGSSGSGSSDQQITEGAQGVGSSGSYTGAGIGSTESGSNTGIKGGSSSFNSGIYGNSGGASFGQSGVGSIESGIKGGHSGSNSGIYGNGGEPSFGQAGVAIPTPGSYEASGSGYFGQAGIQPGAVQYWWNGPDSPFGLSGKPFGGCSSEACSLAGNFDLSKGSGGAHASNQGGQVGLHINPGNPFFNQGQAGSGSGFISSGASIGQSGIASGSTIGPGFDRRPIDGSKNPFLNGGYVAGSSGSGANAGSGSFASANAGSSASSSGSDAFGSSSSTGTFIGGGNPFLQPGSGSGQIPEVSGPVPSSTPVYDVPQESGFGVGAHNPFLKPGSGSVVITSPIAKFPDQSNQGLFPYPSPSPGFPSQSTISGSLAPQPTPIPTLVPSLVFGGSTPGYIGASSSFGSAGAGDFQSQEGQFPSFPSQSTIDFGVSTPGYPTPSTLIPEQEPSRIDAGLTVSCSGQGRICVLRNLCVNGRVSSNQHGLTQVRTGPQLCKVDREVCCSLDRYSVSTTSFGTGQSSDFSSTGSSSISNSGLSGISSNPTLPSITGIHGQSTGSTGILGQSGQFGSTNTFGQSENQDESGSFGSSGIFGQNEQSGSYDQNQQKESFNFGAQSNSEGSASSTSSFGNRVGSGFTQGFPSSSSLGTPAPTLISVTPGQGFRKPTISTYTPGNSGYASASANANAEASGQAGSGITGSYIHPSPVPSGSGTFTNIKKPGQSGGLFGSSDNSGEDLSAGEPSYKGPSFGIKESSASNGYLPPFGSEPSSNVPAFSKPPAEESGPSNIVPEVKRPPPRPFVPAPITVQVGCAAALICVEEKFCTLEGVISPEPVALTSQQIERRAPLSSCKNPDNGIIGKCCRDPNYVDPWPTGNLPANYSGGFDEQGFPSYLNYAKTHPPKKQPPPTKTGFRQPIKGSGVTPNPLQKNPITDALNGNFSWPSSITSSFPAFQPPDFSQVGNYFSNLFGQMSEKPPPVSSETSHGSSDSGTGGVPFPPLTAADTPATEKPANNFFGIPLPNFPFQTAGGSRTDDLSSATNQNPAIIAPHTPGTQCGLRNKVQRPSGLDRDDVAFGEIPWQAMVLSTKDRKLLCSGAIVSPNAVLTAAHCVYGFKSGEVSIKSGEWKLGYELKHEEPLPFEIVTVSQIALHPGFRQGSPSHDLAILYLEHPVALDQHVDILCLGNIPQPKPGRKCIATGWGKIVLQVNVAGSLMHGIDVDLLPQDECRQRLQSAESQIEIDNTLTCVKAHNQRNNMCQVDVGGPLACDRGDGYYELTGIYSQDTGCLPTSQVASFALIDTNWVKKNLLSPPRVPIPSYEVDLPNLGESPSPSNVQPNFGAQVKQPAATCDCQKSHLPPDLNQYLPPV